MDLKILWISLLLPMGSAVFALLLGYSSAADFELMILIMVMSVVFGWIMFFSALRDRLRGRSFVILVCAYPLVQVFVSATTFFFGCLGLLSLDG